jgi:hypothetical protein
MSKIVQIWRRVINKIAKPNIQEIWKNVIWRGHLWVFVIYLETKTPFSSMFFVHKKKGDNNLFPLGSLPQGFF